MSDGDALLAAILAHPEEDTPRLMYADALEERGKPGDAERAEFIRVQCAAARTENEADAFELDQRADWLLAANELAWYSESPLGSIVAKAIADNVVHGRELVVPQWRRGFVDQVTCTAADWLAHADALLAAHPVTAVRLTTLPPTDGDEDDIWFVDDPAAVRIPPADILAEQTAEERDAHNSMAALCRLRWRRVKVFEFPRELAFTAGAVVPYPPPEAP